MLYRKIIASIDQYIAGQAIEAPTETPYAPLWQPPADVPSTLELSDGKISAVIWCIGFRTDFRWIDAPMFDQRGYPHHERGVTAEPGLYFLGLQWQYTWGSGRFSGIARDAAYLLEHISAARSPVRLGPRRTAKVRRRCRILCSDFSF